MKQKDADITGLVARVVGEYKRATLKVRYELLKEYKQGLLVDTDIEMEIELFEESIAEASVQTSAPVQDLNRSLQLPPQSLTRPDLLGSSHLLSTDPGAILRNKIK